MQKVAYISNSRDDTEQNDINDIKYLVLFVSINCWKMAGQFRR